MMYKLKLKNSASGEIRRTAVNELRFNVLEQQLANLFNNGLSQQSNSSKFKVSYMDEERDEIVISSDDELQAAYGSVLSQNAETLVLNIAKIDTPATASRLQEPSTPLSPPPQQQSTPHYPPLQEQSIPLNQQSFAQQEQQPQAFSQQPPNSNPPPFHPQFFPPYGGYQHPYQFHTSPMQSFLYANGLHIEQLAGRFLNYAEAPVRDGFRRLRCGFRSGACQMGQFRQWSFFRMIKALIFFYLFAFVALPVGFHSLYFVASIMGVLVKIAWFGAMIKLAFVVMTYGSRALWCQHQHQQHHYHHQQQHQRVNVS